MIAHFVGLSVLSACFIGAYGSKAQRISALCLISLYASLLYVQPAHAQSLLLLDKSALTKARSEYLQNKDNSPQANIILKANDALLNEAYTVTDKKIMPPSGDKQDYLSISRYWWPDESKTDGLPWLRRDGINNPDTQTDHVDRKRIGKMSESVHALAVAYYYTQDEQYALKASELLQTWFLNADTAMNPHLQYAQSVPGHNKLRRSGILDGRLISTKVLDAISLIRQSAYWSDEQNQAMNAWLGDYLNWLRTSKLGRSGAKQTNNHGSWYFFQVTAIAWYLQDTDAFNEAIVKVKQHITEQFDENGSQPHEIARTRTFFYSSFNLDALSNIALIAQQSGINLWHFPNKENSILKKGVEYLIPAAQGETWPHPERQFDASHLNQALAQYVKWYPAPQYQSLLNDLATTTTLIEYTCEDLLKDYLNTQSRLAAVINDKPRLVTLVVCKTGESPVFETLQTQYFDPSIKASNAPVSGFRQVGNDFNEATSVSALLLTRSVSESKFQVQLRQRTNVSQYVDIHHDVVLEESKPVVFVKDGLTIGVSLMSTRH